MGNLSTPESVQKLPRALHARDGVRSCPRAGCGKSASPVRREGCGNGAMVEPLRHRQTKGAANRYARPTAAAPHSDSTDSSRPECAMGGRSRCGWHGSARPEAVLRGCSKRADSGRLLSVCFRMGKWQNQTLRALRGAGTSDPMRQGTAEAERPDRSSLDPQGESCQSVTHSLAWRRTAELDAA